MVLLCLQVDYFTIISFTLLDLGLLSVSSDPIHICYLLGDLVVQASTYLDASAWSLEVEILDQPSSVIATQQYFYQPPVLQVTAIGVCSACFVKLTKN